MQKWPVQDAKARFSELLDTCLQNGPQMVTKRGAEAAVEAAVLVPVDTLRQVEGAARPTLKELLLAPEPRAELAMPDRGRFLRRAATTLE